MISLCTMCAKIIWRLRIRRRARDVEAVFESFFNNDHIMMNMNYII